MLYPIINITLIIITNIFKILDLSLTKMEVLGKIKENIICTRNSKINGYNK